MKGAAYAYYTTDLDDTPLSFWLCERDLEKRDLAYAQLLRHADSELKGFKRKEKQDIRRKQEFEDVKESLRTVKMDKRYEF